MLLAFPAKAAFVTFQPGDLLRIGFTIAAVPDELSALTVSVAALFPSFDAAFNSTETGQIALFRDGTKLAQGAVDNWGADALGVFTDPADASATAVGVNLADLQPGRFAYLFTFSVSAGTLTFDPTTISLELNVPGGAYYPSQDPALIAEPPAASLLAGVLVLTILLVRSGGKVTPGRCPGPALRAERACAATGQWTP
jgi:hypothetical protein